MIKILKSPERVFHISMWIISFVFASFLIGLGGKLIADLPKIDQATPIEAFADQAIIRKTDKVMLDANESLQKLRQSKEEAQGNLDSQNNAYQNEREKHRNWLSTRSATSSNPNSIENDPELIQRTRKLDSMGESLRQAQEKIESVNAQILSVEQGLENSKIERAKELNRVRAEYFQNTESRNLKVFGLRLLLTAPLLLISGWLILRKRKSSYWPLARGFIIFSAFAFFFELVPYLPSYGGYVRYGVGILISLVISHYSIRWMQRYLEKRKAEEALSELQRRESMDSIQAIAKISAHVCPGCERQIPSALDGVKVNNCVYCGLKLFDICNKNISESDIICGVRKNAFYPHCPSCGKSKNK